MLGPRARPLRGPHALGDLAPAALLRYLGRVTRERNGRELVYALRDAHVGALRPVDGPLPHREHHEGGMWLSSDVEPWCRRPVAILNKYFPDGDAILPAWHERQVAATSRSSPRSGIGPVIRVGG